VVNHLQQQQQQQHANPSVSIMQVVLKHQMDCPIIECGTSQECRIRRSFVLARNCLNTNHEFEWAMDSRAIEKPTFTPEARVTRWKRRERVEKKY
jgi:hypothetical protein